MEVIKVVLVGSSCSGKTGFAYRVSESIFEEDYPPTVFDNFCVKLMVDGEPVTVGLWDTSKLFIVLRFVVYNISGESF